MSCRLLFFNLCRDLSPVLLPGKSHGWRSLVGYSPWGRWESDTSEQLHFHFSLSCIGEGSGNPLQCSCLENPRDEGAWRAAVYGVAQSQTRLQQLSSSSSSSRDLSVYLVFQRTCFWFGWFSFVYFVFSVSLISALIFKLFFLLHTLYLIFSFFSSIR